MEDTGVQSARYLLKEEQAVPFLGVQKSHISISMYLGLGTRSSGTGVQVESGDFCSLNLPVKTLAMSSMS